MLLASLHDQPDPPQHILHDVDEDEHVERTHHDGETDECRLHSATQACILLSEERYDGSREAPEPAVSVEGTAANPDQGIEPGLGWYLAVTSPTHSQREM